ncbi:MAG: hypothetical protein JNN05_02665, partial [Candidatus Omnitrophica bacterium]|nr:hypothetical protein [Candidatus Omnitrophota bacterium]
MKNTSIKLFFLSVLFLSVGSVVSFGQEAAKDNAVVTNEIAEPLSPPEDATVSSDSSANAPESLDPGPLTAISKTVKSIEILGNKSIGVAAILSKIKTRIGQEYIENVVSDDLKRLYNTGYFFDVKVE